MAGLGSGVSDMEDNDEKDPSEPTGGGAWLKGPLQLPFIVAIVVVAFLATYVLMQ